MTVTDDQPEVAPARQAINEMVDAGLLDHLMSKVDGDGLALTGEGGLLPELVKAVLERGLQAELTDHLGYEKGDPAGRGSSNSRNGSTPKRLASIADLVDLSNELWAECIAAYFGQARLIGGEGRGQRILQKAEQAQYDISVARKFLSIQGIDGGLHALGPEELTGLRGRYGHRVSQIIREALSSLPASLGDTLVVDKAVERIVGEYSNEVKDLLRHSRPRASAIAGGVALDVSGIFVAPIGLYSVFHRLGKFVFARRRAPLQWFVFELMDRIDRSPSDD